MPDHPSTALRADPANGNHRRAALIIIGAALVARLLLAAEFPLIADEAYAVVVSRQPALSYFDHPMLGFGFARLSAWLFGSESSLVVRLPNVLFGAASGWLLFLLTRRAFGSQAAVWAVAWFSVAPFFLVSSGHFAVPDGPLNFFLLLTLWFVFTDLLGDGKPVLWRWLLAGAALGLAVLSKYTAALFGVSAVLVLLASLRGRRLLATPAPWLTGAVAALFLAPIIIWNAQNDWVSLGFQSGRAVGGGFDPLRFLFVQLGQAGFLLPWVWAVAVFVMLRAAIQPRVPAERIFAILALVPVVVFDIIAMFGRETLPHWAMPGFLFSFPLIGLWCADFAERRAGALRGVFAVSAVLVIALGITGVLQARNAAPSRALGLPEGAEFDWTFLDWDALQADFAERGIAGDADAFIVPASWLIGAKAGHALGPEMPIATPLADPRHFAFQHDDRLDARGEGYAITAAWPRGAETAEADLKRSAEAGYRLAGDSWRIAEMRGGRPSFIIIVQPVAPRD